VIYEQDYLMRSIVQLIQFLAKIILGKETVKYELSGEGLCYNSGHDDKIVLSERKINHVQKNPTKLR